jgi:hypothetical protein
MTSRPPRRFAPSSSRLLEGVIVATVSIVVVCATLATTLAG